MDRELLYQTNIREEIELSLGNELMIPLFGPYKQNEKDIFINSYLIPIDKADEQLKTDTCDVRGLEPGFTQYGAGENSEVVYSRYNNSIGAEPLVISRNFNGLAEDYNEISEEFRLLFNLYFNKVNNEYIDLIDNTKVIEINDKGFTRVNKKYLKRYLAVKNMVLVLCVDSRYFLSEFDESINDDSVSYSDDSLVYNLKIGKCGVEKLRNFSLLYAKKLIYGCKLIDCGIWPYEEKKEYENFIIGMDEDGKDISFTCNPDKLSNYFGANPSAPHYLTPVYFDKEVLNKYYSKPEVYKVDDCIIRCGDLWSLYIDNQKLDYVSAYLGDLGRDLPSKKEQLHWKSYNKAIDGSLSKTKFQRDFMSISTNPEAVDFIFKNKYIETNEKFKNKLGWNLFLELDNQDKYNFEGLRIPVTNSIVEMDMLTLSLVKVLLDSLNEKNILKQLTGTYEKLNGSISRLEMWLKEKQLVNYQEHIKFLRNLQQLRSRGTGHRKGEGYSKIAKVFDVSKGNYIDSFSSILEQAVSFLDYMCENIEKLK